MNGDTPPRVLVAGAGIGGLCLAAALDRVGVPCDVREQAAAWGPVGVGLQLAPSAVRLLHRLGLAGELRACATRPRALEIRWWRDGSLLSRTELGDSCEALYGAPYYTVHRADLHDALLGLVGHRVHPGHRLIGVEQRENEAVAHFADGAVLDADAIVGADGVHSTVRASVLRDRAAPVFAGQVVYRGLVPADRVARLGGEPMVNVWVGPDRHCVCYPVSSGGQFSFAATAPAAGQPPAESWSVEGDPRELAAAFAGWNDSVQELVRAAGPMRRWSLHDREPLTAWSVSRVTLLGDAAHPMLPFMAQGANQAIEDAAVLAACLAASPVDVPDALRRYEAIRMPRTALVQRGSRQSGRAMHTHDGVAEPRRDSPVRKSATATLAALAWLYGYDAEQAAARR